MNELVYDFGGAIHAGHSLEQPADDNLRKNRHKKQKVCAARFLRTRFIHTVKPRKRFRRHPDSRVGDGVSHPACRLRYRNAHGAVRLVVRRIVESESQITEANIASDRDNSFVERFSRQNRDCPKFRRRIRKGRRLRDCKINRLFLGIIFIQSDDGVSRVAFNRPAIMELLDLVRNERVNCIAVKDFSSFGRNAIEVGNYIEHAFPLFRTVVSVGDGHDSAAHEGYTGGIEIAQTTNREKH